MKRTITLSVFGMTLLILVSGGRAQADSGKGGSLAKVSRDLAVLYDEYVAYLDQGSVETFKPSNSLLRVIDGRVVIDAVASGDAGTLQSDLEALGMKKAAAFGRMVSGQLPILAIDDMAALDSLKFARPAYASTRTGVTNLGTKRVPTPSPPQKEGVVR